MKSGRLGLIWHALRRDIGRKLTALALALTLWGILQSLVIDKRSFNLEIRTAASRQEAEQRLAEQPAVYLVVPKTLLITGLSNSLVHVSVEGLAGDVQDMRLSAVLDFGEADLGGADAAAVLRTLERKDFDAEVAGERREPELTLFKVRPESLRVELARRDAVTLTLSALNVVTTGAPREGYLFQESKISLRPNQVDIEGPRAAIEPLRLNPGAAKLAPVNVAGKSASVSQSVGLSAESLGRNLLMKPETVEVTIPIVNQDLEVELLGVPVAYLHESVLALRGKKVQGKLPETADVLIIGPHAELSGLSTDQLRARIMLVFDWAQAPPELDQQANAKLKFLRGEGLSASVRVQSLIEAREPGIEYQLVPLVAPP
ncbi:MAG: CdaR family protein [Planctomycetota bacterium]